MITVVIPSYHYGHLIAHAVESVLNQTREADKIIVVDDGVHDVPLKVNKYPVKVFRRISNLGIVDNFNDMLFNHVDTDRVMFLGADNWLHPEALELMDVEEDIVSCDAYIVGKGKYKIWELPFQPHGSALYSVEKARAVGGYEDSGNEHTEEDSMLFNKMLDKGATFSRIVKPLLYYRRHMWNFNDHSD